MSADQKLEELIPALKRSFGWLLLTVLGPIQGCEREAPPAKLWADPAAAATGPTLLFLGDSLTFGYGLSPEFSYPSLIGEKLREAGLEYGVVNAGVSGDTTASGLRRLDWLLRQAPAVLILALGGNDGLRGIPVETTRSNLQQIVDQLRERDPDIQIVLTGMQAPPNMGQRFTDGFRRIFSDLAEQNELALVPFLLEGVAGDPDLNQADGIHPNQAGQRIVAENVWQVLEPLLR